MRRHGLPLFLRRHGWLPLFLVATFVLAVTALLVIVLTAGTPANTLQYELAKGLIQVMLVVVLGTTLTWLVEIDRTEREAAAKERDGEQAEREYRAELIKGVLARATASYSAVKRARRLMRALALAPSADGRRDVLAGPYDVQMIEVNNAQLEFENLRRDVRTSRSLLRDLRAVTDALRVLDKYVGDLITEYEQERPHFSGDPVRISLDRMPRLAAFLNPRSPTFNANVSRQFKQVQSALRRELLAQAE